MACTQGIARIIVFVANFVFLLVGVALITVGVLIKLNIKKYTEAIPDDYHVIEYVPVATIVVGAIVFVIAFLGCCGACRSNTCMLTTYSAILIVIFLVQVGLGVYALVKIKDKQDLHNALDKAITKLFGECKSNESKCASVDVIQEALECCGTSGQNFWNYPPRNSCFDMEKRGEYFKKGCVDAMTDFVEGSVKLIAVVVMSIAGAEIFGAILALCLSNCIKSDRQKGRYY